MTDKEIFEKNIKKNSDMLPLLLAEECGELIQAVSKLNRFIRFNNNIMSLEQISEKIRLSRNVAEEIADIQIVIEQIMMLYDIADVSVELSREYKLKRLEQRLKEGTE